jgi:hypothetical protein
MNLPDAAIQTTAPTPEYPKPLPNEKRDLIEVPFFIQRARTL